MRPRKVRPVKNKYAEICREKGIRLRGSVRRDNWPREHRHHFQAIYSIGSTQFEQYIGNQEIPQERRTTVENDVVSLTQKVNDLLNDIQTNEATWRRLERDILHKFDDFVLWFVAIDTKIMLKAYRQKVSNVAMRDGSLTLRRTSLIQKNKKSFAKNAILERCVPASMVRWFLKQITSKDLRYLETGTC